MKQAAKEEGYSGHLVFRVSVSQTGQVAEIVLQSPDVLRKSDRVREAIRSLMFCPAVKFSQYTSSTINFDVKVD